MNDLSGSSKLLRVVLQIRVLGSALNKVPVLGPQQGSMGTPCRMDPKRDPNLENYSPF